MKYWTTILMMLLLALAACDPDVPDDDNTNDLRLDEWQSNWSKIYLLSRPKVATGTEIFPYCKANLCGITSLNDTLFLFASVYQNYGNYYRFISTDAGASWQKTHQTVGTGVLEKISYCGGRRLIASLRYATDVRLAVSENMGLSWDFSNIQSHDNPQFLFSSELNGILYNDAGVYHTTDGGYSWIPLSTDTFNQICMSGNGTLIGVRSDGVYTSADTGDSWTQRYSSPNALVSVYANDNVVFAGGKRGSIIRSTDHGQNWTPKFDLLSLYGSADNAEVQGFVMLDNANGFAAVSDDYVIDTGGELESVVGILLRTSDGGETWVSNYRSEIIKYHDLIALPGPIVLATGKQEEDYYVTSIYITRTTTLGN